MIIKDPSAVSETLKGSPIKGKASLSCPEDLVSDVGV